MDALLIYSTRFTDRVSLQDGYQPYHHHCHYNRLSPAHHGGHLQQVQMMALHQSTTTISVNFCSFGVWGGAILVYIARELVLWTVQSRL